MSVEIINLLLVITLFVCSIIIIILGIKRLLNIDQLAKKQYKRDTVRGWNTSIKFARFEHYVGWIGTIIVGLFLLVVSTLGIIVLVR